MPVKLIEEKEDGTIHPSQLKDGQIAVVTAWTFPEHVGNVVIRRDDVLFSINRRASWERICLGLNPRCDCRVRVLPNGTKLEIVDNE